MRECLKDGYHIFEYEFDTLHAFLEYVKSAPVNTRIFGGYQSSQESNRTDWHGTNDYAEAEQLCQSGWDDGFERLTQLKRRIDEKLLNPDILMRQTANVVGYAPIVPAYLQGHPLNMCDRTEIRIPTFIDIYINIAYSWNTETSAILNRGIIALSLVDALESRGYTVRLKVFEVAYKEKEISMASFNLKGDGEKLNIKKCYFPLCHRSFLRRLVLRLLEVTPVRNDWSNGYGIPAEAEMVKKLLDLGSNDIVIVQPYDMGVTGENLERDLDAILKFTNLEGVLAKA